MTEYTERLLEALNNYPELHAEIVSTGGGCTAVEVQVPSLAGCDHPYVWITDDASAPDGTDPITAGFYTGYADAEGTEYADFPDPQEEGLFDKLAAWCEERLYGDHTPITHDEMGLVYVESLNDHGQQIMTVGQLKKIIHSIPDDTHVVTDDPEHGWWLNITKVVLPSTEEGVGHFTVTFMTEDTFDPRQF